jgi:hypothetical protein
LRLFVLFPIYNKTPIYTTSAACQLILSTPSKHGASHHLKIKNKCREREKKKDNEKERREKERIVNYYSNNLNLTVSFCNWSGKVLIY